LQRFSHELPQSHKEAQKAQTEKNGGLENPFVLLVLFCGFIFLRETPLITL
jgi:hypothetical protein